MIFQKDSLIGTSDDGLAYATVIIPGKIHSGDTLKYATSWLSNKNHEQLPKGVYDLDLKSHITIDDAAPSKPIERITFTINE
jgi:hypothetical protein